LKPQARSRLTPAKPPARLAAGGGFPRIPPAFSPNPARFAGGLKRASRQTCKAIPKPRPARARRPYAPDKSL
jgi:hypothetical protein